MTTEQISQDTHDLSIEDTILYLIRNTSGRVVFSTSFGQEDQVLTHIISESGHDVGIFTLDTGRLFEETYEVWQATEIKYKRSIKAYYPHHMELEELIEKQGINGFYDSVINRQLCCEVRKINPLKRALSGAKVWITGLRSSQSTTRSELLRFEFDVKLGILKYNPLIDWTLDDVLSFIRLHNIPYNTLHNKGYLSIGCAPCTRAILPGEDTRAGRWWWEESKKECGLHR